MIYYHLKSKPSSEVSIEILDASGRSARKFTSKAPASQGAPAQPSGEGGFGGGGSATRLPAKRDSIALSGTFGIRKRRDCRE